jgi:hypothetical protein
MPAAFSANQLTGSMTSMPSLNAQFGAELPMDKALHSTVVV